MSSYEVELESHIEYLKLSIQNMPGVEQGYLVRDDLGDVIHRVGRISLNPPWYREFYSKHGRRPYVKELEELAKEHLENGFYDDFGFIPPYNKRKDLSVKQET